MESGEFASVLMAPFMCLLSVLPCGFGAIMVLFYVLMMIIGLVGLVLWILMIVDIAQRPDEQFPGQGKDQKLLWILVVVLGGWIGALIYYLMVYRQKGAAVKG